MSRQLCVCVCESECECTALSSFLKVCFDGLLKKKNKKKKFNNTFLLALYTVNQNKDCFEFNIWILGFIQMFTYDTEQRNTAENDAGMLVLIGGYSSSLM